MKSIQTIFLGATAMLLLLSQPAGATTREDITIVSSLSATSDALGFARPIDGDEEVALRAAEAAAPHLTNLAAGEGVLDYVCPSTVLGAVIGAGAGYLTFFNPVSTAAGAGIGAIAGYVLFGCYVAR